MFGSKLTPSRARAIVIFSTSWKSVPTPGTAELHRHSDPPSLDATGHVVGLDLLRPSPADTRLLVRDEWIAKGGPNGAGPLERVLTPEDGLRRAGRDTHACAALHTALLVDLGQSSLQGDGVNRAVGDAFPASRAGGVVDTHSNLLFVVEGEHCVVQNERPSLDVAQRHGSSR